MKIAITDANIFIDLFGLEQLHWLELLHLEVYTTDLVLNELLPEQAAAVRPFITLVSELTMDDIATFPALNSSPGLSETDRSVIWQTTQITGPFIVLTGDNLIRKWCERHYLEVHGILWIFDQLVNNQHLSKQEALIFLQRIMQINQWLPSKECEIRIKAWK